MKRMIGVLAMSALTACGGSVDEGPAPADYTMEVSGDKADTRYAVARDVSEPLRSNYLKDILCDAIASSGDVSVSAGERIVQDCRTLDFTVVREHVSTEYQYADGRAMTVGLDVEVQIERPDATAVGTLRRAMNDEFKLEWTANAVIDLGDHSDVLEQLQRTMGEYFWLDELEGTDFEGRVHPLAPEDLPELVRETAQRVADDETAEMQHYEPDTEDYAAIGSEDSTFEVQTAGGETAGYVVIIGYMIDAPHYDGAGINLYITADGVIAAQESFSY